MISLFFGGWHWGATIDGFLAAHVPSLWIVPRSLIVSLLTLVLWSIKVVLFCCSSC